MDTPFLTSLLADYQWLLSLYVIAGMVVLTVLGGMLLKLNPAIKAASQLNKDVFRAKMERPAYAANQKWNRKWSLLYLIVSFGIILPFCLTLEPQPWWQMLIDAVVILMFYDFVYYLTHRFVFHKKPLLWMHAIHHRQHNPCRMDSSYIHPLEVAIGLGLFVMSMFVLSRFMGDFHVATVVVSWIAFSGINVHNHARWDTDRFPFKYLNYAARMHHNHHATFSGGNFATITLLYDWMFGTLDRGDGAKKPVDAEVEAEA